ncbi:MAG: EF-hand domain-containing protein [Sphingomonadaceae bacterium]
MKALSTAVLIAAVVLGAGGGQAQTQTEGRRLADLTFDTFDLSGRGYVDMGQMLEVQDLFFVSMDRDENDRVSLDEFLSWDYGFSNIAADTDREAAYRTALKVVHSFWDRNGDGEVSRRESRRAVFADFRRADVDDDGLLSREEFVGGFSVMVALRAALGPLE